MEPIEAPGDDALGELERELNELIRSARNRQQERLLFAVGPVVLFRWQNREGWPIEYVSRNVEALTGYPFDDFASGRRAYASVIHEADISRVFEEVGTNTARAVPWFVHQPYRLVRADGEPIWVSDYTVLVRDEQGEVTHYFGYIIDISEQVTQLGRLRAQEQVIERISSPILQVGRGVLAMPVLGHLHGDRATRMTEELLAAVSRHSAQAAILDLTGLQEIDTSTVQSLLRASRAVNLLGCRCILSGISPLVATLIVKLGLEAQSLTTVATLEDALALALRG